MSSPKTRGAKGSQKPNNSPKHKHGSKAQQEALDKWLRASGYPLEMNTVSAFRDAGFMPSPSTYYVDPETSILRELDVLAGWWDVVGGAIVNLSFVAQCKKSELPWVLFSATPGPTTFSRARFPLTTGSPLGQQFLHRTARLSDEVQYHPFVAGPVWTGYSLTAGLTMGQDVPYEAAITVIKATDHTVKEMEPDQQDDVVVQLVFPVIVVDSALYVCFLNADGEPETSLIDSGLLVWRRGGGSRRQRFIHVVTKPHLQQFAQGAAQFRATLLQHGAPVLKGLVEKWNKERDSELG